MAIEAPAGKVVWIDLTVPDADSARKFYTSVVGLESEPLDMGGYSDYVMKSPGIEDGVAGICHARGENADQPAQWMLYFQVADVSESIEACVNFGGKVVVNPRQHGDDCFAVLADPAGAVFAVYGPNAQMMRGSEQNGFAIDKE